MASIRDGMKKGQVAMSIGVFLAVVIVIVAMYYVFIRVDEADNFQNGKCFGAKDVQKCCDDWAKNRKQEVLSCQGRWEVVNSTSICAWKCG